ncbi:MAG: glycosyl transferase group 1 [Candidatus Peregrinibacteria bacterium GW2011_GWF2_33_10]|nr:MAG: glycosyl transferase group 1 [Candidatus Peregrinibacteria bacterium GW2011_GWF2_33_10]OGJ44923.1 MAG: hypothetical protein A2263_03140 [Candidatus Peregrinibacteria bacterium RIFOXYA2_FULL_33_21]OGJ45284.1 MAG: hypothetical protein A2272_02225 [Candidatus Peregrinibacteria bacterium RIFOXYA12_FULL_33_12]OGJ50683.1 MAG: hypothetical protein A2307_03430 [Candidatus Peregrinibacteria bacterium RIFOXYB2_FULL_33_20]
MKVALVHDFLNRLGGAERVLQTLSEIFPSAPIYTLLYDETKVGKVFPQKKIRFSSIQKFPNFFKNRIKYFLPFLTTEVEKWDFSEYDLVISSSSAFAHGIVTNLKTKHIVYSHSPMRSLWDWHSEYLVEQKKNFITNIGIKYITNKLRIWDFYASKRAEIYIANSKNVQERIKKYYHRDSQIIYPPIDLQRFKPQKEHENYFLIVSTLTPYKNIELAINLFNKIGRKLVIIGDGPQKTYLESISASNIEFLGFKPDEIVAEYLQNCRAFIFPGEEDFGISPVEAMACGKPVLAYAKGGLLETVISNKTGEFFGHNTLESIEDGLSRLMLNENNYDYQKIAKHAEQFSKEKFKILFHKLTSHLLSPL